MRPLALWTSSILLLIISTAVQAQSLQAAMDDYVWELLPADDEPFAGKVCEQDYEERFASYDECEAYYIQMRDNSLIKDWGISDKVSREKDAIHVRLPHRQKPFIFKDRQDDVSEDSNYSYALYHYDQDAEVLLITKGMWETTNSVAVHFKSGIIQEFDGSQLTFSPDYNHAVSLETYPDYESVMMWSKQRDGHYRLDHMEAEALQKIQNHLSFYSGYGSNPFLDNVTINWLTNSQLLVDFYFKINDEDSAAYRVRFNVVKPYPQASWQIIAVK